VTDNSTHSDTYPPTVWRLIVHRPADGPTNMAIDEAITEHVRAGDAPPTLRFYGWDPACLSLGRGQPVSDVDLERLHARGWDVVRRQTGGRAILHVDELTYSISIPQSDPRVQGDLVDSYRQLSRGLMAGLALLEAPVHSEQADKDAHGFKGPVCFEVPSDYEITAYGRKLLGSAQTRRDEMVLQHGALPLRGDIGRICDALAFDTEAAREKARARVVERAITLGEALGRAISFEGAATALAEGFCQALNVRLEEGALSEAEEARAEQLRVEKYTAEGWTARQ
jgi:lipoyl(octanoyl) transferase